MIKNKVITALLLITCPSLTAIHVVYKKSDPKADLSIEKKKYIDGLLETYDWPASVDLLYDQKGNRKTKNYTQASADLKQIEEMGGTTPWLAQKISQRYPELSVLWVPNTIWDLFRLFEIHTKGIIPENTTKDRSNTSANFVKALFDAKLLNAKIAPDWSDKNSVKRFLLPLLAGFRKKSAADFDIFPLQQLVKEVGLIKKDVSLITSAIDAEIQAHNDHSVLLFRATSGVRVAKNGESFENLALDFLLPKIVEKDPEREARQKAYDEAAAFFFSEVMKDLSKRTEDIIASMPDDMREAFNNPPAPAPQPSSEDISIESILSDLSSIVKSDNFETLDLSFSYGLFSGCGSDSDFGVCTYLYAAKNSPVLKRPILYTLKLPEYFLLTRGKQLFYLPRNSPADQVEFAYSSSILTHPRVRRIGEIRRQVDVHMGAEIFALGRLAPLKYTNLLGSVPNKKFLSFTLEIQELLGRNTNVIAIDGENIESAGQKKKATMLINNQKQTMQLLENAVSDL